MAKRRRRSRRSRRSRHSRRSSGGSKQIRTLLTLAGVGFGLYMAMKALGKPAYAPVATVDGRNVPLSIMTDADLRAADNAVVTNENVLNA